MKIVKLILALASLVLALLPSLGDADTVADYSDDTFLFNQPQVNSTDAPNILFILDNSSNWSRNNQHWPNVSTQGGAELAAIAKLVNNQTKPVNIGLMMFTDSGGGGPYGGYVRFGLRDVSASANKTAFTTILNGIDPNSSSEKTNSGKYNYANTLYESWLYFTNAASWAGMDGNADFSTNSNALTTNKVGLSSGFAYASSSTHAQYSSALGGGTGCGKTYIVFIGNNTKGSLPSVPGSSDPSTLKLAQYNYSTAPYPQSAWAKFLNLRPDLGAGSPAAINGSVTTFAIDAYYDQPDSDFTSMMKDMALKGGSASNYYPATSTAQLDAALADIMNKIQAVNSVFASVSLPVSVSVRGTYLNQVYLGMFRPDANAKPNWVGNLKQYQLSVDTSTTPPTVFMADVNGVGVENTTTGFVTPGATSFWTKSSTFWNSNYYPNSQGQGGNSDAPDGDLVEKGGAAEYLRNTFPTDQSTRKIYTYTCSTGCSTPVALSSTPFVYTSASSTISSLLGLTGTVTPDVVINWVRGGDTAADDSPATTTPTAPRYNIRGFSHGDVLHSRPAVINYNRNGNADDIVVFYGANDGMLHAVQGGQGTSGGTELWSFIPQELLGKFQRMYSHTPKISTSTPKPYFVDGSPTTYTVTDATGAVTSAYLFVTMRRGGPYLYAFDVTDPANPKLLWRHSSSDSGFGELGQTWSDMRVAKLKANGGNPVLIFGLGYDGTNDTAVQGTASSGRGVMVLDALSGSVVWQAGRSATTGANGLNVPGMNYAIAANIAVYDSNRDGYIDRLYAADTGANLWRINVGDASPANWTVSLLAQLGGSGVNARKFFYPPDIVPATALNPTDSLMIGSGDREHPFDISIQNRFYMIKDDHGLNAIPSTITEGTVNGTSGSAGTLYDATSNASQVGSATDAAAANAALASSSGWYIRLAAGEKGVSGSTTMGGSTIFATNLPVSVSANLCTSNLGESRLYMVSYLTGAATVDLNGSGGISTIDRYKVRAGGGFAPTPVPVSVKLGDHIYQVAISGTQVLNPPGVQVDRRYRTFWRRTID